MEVKLNGKSVKLKNRLTVSRLLEELGVNPDTAAVELNGSVLARGERVSAEIVDGDVVEIIHFMGGG